MDGDIDGVLNALKPPGMTSHDVVAFARKVTRIARIGHTGTLDPGAAGVLPLCIGRATRIAEYLTAIGKSYRVEMTLGVFTSTDDSSGKIIGEMNASSVTEATVRAALEEFRGEIVQRAPGLSAKKYRGVRSYDIVRAGGEPEPRWARVYVHDISLVSFAPGSRCLVTFDLTCSSGTYVRSLCSSIGQVVGCGGYMSFLLRTEAGGFSVDASLTLEEIEEATIGGRLAEIVTPMAIALRFMPGFILSREASERLSHGLPPRKSDIIGEAGVPGSPAVSLPAALGSPSAASLPSAAYGTDLKTNAKRESLVRLVDLDGRLAAVARHEPGQDEFLLEKVISGV